MSEVATAQPTALMSFIERAARDESFDLQKFRELLTMQNDQVRAQQRHEFNIAMAEVQAELEPITRDRKNEHLRTKYATANAIDAAARPIYTAHGFSIRFGTAPAPNEGWVRVVCEIAHTGGYSEQHYLDGPLDREGSSGTRNKTGIQAVGSTISYLRRYLMLLILNLVTVDDDDDDGEATRARNQDRQAADAYPSSSRRENINRDVPLRGQQRDGRSIWLDWLEQEMRKQGSLAEVNALIAHERVQLANKEFAGDYKTRLDRIIADGLAAHAPVTHTEPQDEWPSGEATGETEAA